MSGEVTRDCISVCYSNPGRYHKDPELDPQKARFQAGVIRSVTINCFFFQGEGRGGGILSNCRLLYLQDHKSLSSF